MVKLSVEKEFSRKRLDQYLSYKFPDISRAKIQKFIRSGNVSINNIDVTKCNFIINEKDIIQIEIPQIVKSNLEPEQIELDIIYEDEYLIIVNKPPFMIVHPFGEKLNNTLVNALLNHTSKLSGVAGPLKPGIVHRLDKDTSGALIIAKNDFVHLDLLKQFKDRTVEKYYIAIVHGIIKENEFDINFSIGRNPKDRTKMSIHARSTKEARTKITVRKRFKEHTFIQVRIFTGRTHQIRVHLASLKYFVVGDKKYGGKNYGKKNNLGLKRQALHAFRVCFDHPVQQKRMMLEAPIPDDFNSALELAKRTSNSTF